MMARASSVVREGPQPILVKIFQVSRAATARSPRQRIQAWALFTASCRRDNFGR
jgi:hypothetical protein